MRANLVAHRGYRKRYPENTILALAAAIDAGVHYLEFDVQLSSDRVPMVFHDDKLDRTTNLHGSFFDYTEKQLGLADASENRRFDLQFSQLAIPSLAEAVRLLEQNPQVSAFVEIKRHSLNHFGVSMVLDRVLELLAPLQHRITIISFETSALEYTHCNSDLSIGWIIRKFTSASHKIAQDLQPQYLVCNLDQCLSVTSLWTGPWQWMVYEVNQPELALQCARRGIQFIETADIEALINQDPFTTMTIGT